MSKAPKVSFYRSRGTAQRKFVDYRLVPSERVQREDLSCSGSQESSVMYWIVPSLISDNEFEFLWSLKPVQREQIFGHVTGRSVRAYERSYRYSGKLTECEQTTPPLISRLLERARNIHSATNGVLLTCYEVDGSIGLHQDSSNGLYIDSKGDVAPIITMSFGDSRDFFLIPDKTINNSLERYRVSTGHGTIIVMDGSCNRTHKHEVPQKYSSTEAAKDKPYGGRRIVLTFRTFSK